MNSTQLFIGLLALLVGLFLIALLQPYVFKKQHVMGVQDFKDELAKLLPSHDFTIKQGSQSRIIVSLEGIQKAIVVIDKPKAEYIMGDLMIFTTNKINQLKKVADKIKGLKTRMN